MGAMLARCGSIELLLLQLVLVLRDSPGLVWVHTLVCGVCDHTSGVAYSAASRGAGGGCLEQLSAAAFGWGMCLWL
jgi:hypothetical protein